MNQTLHLLYFYGGLASFLILKLQEDPHSLKRHGKEQSGHPSFFFYRKLSRTCLEKHEYNFPFLWPWDQSLSADINTNSIFFFF